MTAVATLTKAARSLVPGRAKRSVDKLEKAIAGLRVLVDALAKDEKFYSDATVLFQSHLQRVNHAEHAVMAALETKKIDNVAAALKQPDIKPEFIKCQLDALNAHKAYRTPYNTFLSAHPQAKTILDAVCKLRLEKAKIDEERVLAEEQARLGEDYDANDSPVVKRARGKAGHLQTALNRIQTEPVENVFVQFSSQLLSE